MKKIVFKILLIIVALCALVLPNSVEAHEGFEKEPEQFIGNYIVKIIYDPVDFKASVPQPIQIKLLDKETRQIAEYDYIEIQVKQSNTTLSEEKIFKSQKDTTMIQSYPFPRFGTYEISLHFWNKNADLLQTSFPIVFTEELTRVGARPTGSPTSSQAKLNLSYAVLALPVIVLITLLAKKKRYKKGRKKS